MEKQLTDRVLDADMRTTPRMPTRPSATIAMSSGVVHRTAVLNASGFGWGLEPNAPGPLYRSRDHVVWSSLLPLVAPFLRLGDLCGAAPVWRHTEHRGLFEDQLMSFS